jgi:hypothetical protein
MKLGARLMNGYALKIKAIKSVIDEIRAQFD